MTRCFFASLVLLGDIFFFFWHCELPLAKAYVVPAWPALAAGSKQRGFLASLIVYDFWCPESCTRNCERAGAICTAARVLSTRTPSFERSKKGRRYQRHEREKPGIFRAWQNGTIGTSRVSAHDRSGPTSDARTQRPHRHVEIKMWPLTLGLAAALSSSQAPAVSWTANP